MLRLGGSLLEDLLALDPGQRGPRVECGAGHGAEFVSYRPKGVDSVLGPVTLRRAWYHCTACGHGLAPRDAELGISGASLSPGLRAMVARVGSSEPFAQGRRDLAELAGLELTAKRVERSAEADGGSSGRRSGARPRPSSGAPSCPSGAPPRSGRSTSRSTAPACRPCRGTPRGVGARRPTGAPAPARSSSAACSPGPPWTRADGPSGTSARRAGWPPWGPPSGSARSSTPRPAGGAWDVPAG